MMALNPQVFSLPFHLNGALEAVLSEWHVEDRLSRLWRRDASLWTGGEESRWLGWLDAPIRARPEHYSAIAAEVRAARIDHLVLLGMGGSVLAPAVFAQVFGQRPSFPRLHVLDSVDPAQIRRVEDAIEPDRTLVVVSSKSGSTLESTILMTHFLERLSGERFIAITDPGTVLETLAREKGFRRICRGDPEIGGRFSAFSDFGLVPLAAMGVDVGEFLDETRPMVDACGPDATVLASPGVLLGAALGVLARSGLDKVSLICSPALRDLALWLEQLLAESTGKSGRGIIPVVGEILHEPAGYGRDRVFVYIRLEGDPDPNDGAVDALEEAGRPVFRITVPEAISIGQELFRWETATAVAGSVLGVNPFDQPDVEASKVLTRRLMAEYERDGAFSLQAPGFESDAVRIFPTGPEGSRLAASVSRASNLSDWLAAFLSSRGDGDYVALLAFAASTTENSLALDGLRARLGGNGRWATTLGFGPRYLHSSGQVYKGGPNSGIFLVLTSGDREDLPVPDRSYTFGVVKAAQARADAEALGNAGRRVLRIEVRGDFAAGVRRLADAVAARSA